MYSIISFSIAACKSLRAPSCSSCSKNGFSASSARFSTEITLFSLTGVSFLFGTSGEAAEGLFFLLKGCAFSHLFIHNFRLYLSTKRGRFLIFFGPFSFVNKGFMCCEQFRVRWMLWASSTFLIVARLKQLVADLKPEKTSEPRQ